MKKITIAIDGYSSCGKSTLAKDLASCLNYIYIDSGAMYRAITLFLIQEKIDVDQKETVISSLKEIQIEFKCDEGTNYTYLNQINVEDEIRKIYVSEKVSQVAAIPEVRKKLVHLQRLMGLNKGIIMDGRDIGTVVFPDAELKLFLDAAITTRVERRYRELIEKGLKVEYVEVEANLKKRDRIDSTRTESPLTQAEDAIYFDNTNLTRNEQLSMILALAKERINSIQT